MREIDKKIAETEQELSRLRAQQDSIRAKRNFRCSCGHTHAIKKCTLVCRVDRDGSVLPTHIVCPTSKRPKVVANRLLFLGTTGKDNADRMNRFINQYYHHFNNVVNVSPDSKRRLYHEVFNNDDFGKRAVFFELVEDA